MSASIQLADAATLEDLRVFLERLQRSGEAEVRLVSHDAAFAVYGCTQLPDGLLDTLPVVLVLRVFRLQAAPDSPIDLTVPIRAMLERIAHLGMLETHLVLPDVDVTAAWAGVLPPRSGWVPLGAVDAQSCAAAAQSGMERIAQLLPQQAGDAVVRTVRRQVWSLEIAPGIPAAAAFAAEALGFLRAEERVLISHTRTWTRLSTHRGHVLVRQQFPEVRQQFPEVG